MVIHGWIEDDNCDQLLPCFEKYEFDKEKPGCYITITKNTNYMKNREVVMKTLGRILKDVEFLMDIVVNDYQPKERNN